MTTEQRVNNGVEWLDSNIPGWLDKINLETLNIASDDHCILAQAYESTYNAAVDDFDLDIQQRLNFGFTTGTYTANEMTQAWKEKVRELRASRTDSPETDSVEQILEIVGMTFRDRYMANTNLRRIGTDQAETLANQADGELGVFRMILIHNLRRAGIVDLPNSAFRL